MGATTEGDLNISCYKSTVEASNQKNISLKFVADMPIVERWKKTIDGLHRWVCGWLQVEQCLVSASAALERRPQCEHCAEQCLV